MENHTRISDSEYEVMEVIWSADAPMECAAIHEELSKTKKWAYNTVSTFLTRLVKKGFLAVEKHGRANAFRALVSRQEYVHAQTEEFLRIVHQGSKRSLIAALYDDDVASDELNALIDMVERSHE